MEDVLYISAGQQRKPVPNASNKEKSVSGCCHCNDFDYSRWRRFNCNEKQ